MGKIILGIKSLLRFFKYHVLWRAVFTLSCIFPVDEKLVIFADSYNCSMTDNMECVYNALTKHGGYKFKFFFAAPKSYNKIYDHIKTSIIHLKFCWYYARCSTLLLTDSYLPAFSCKPRSRTQVIQLWHACGAFKKWGYSTALKSWGADRKALKRYPLHNCYSRVCVSSDSVIPHYADAFNCDESIIKAIGVPRTDAFFDDGFVLTRTKSVRESIPNLGNRKIILYAPTFRGSDLKSARFDDPLDYRLLKEFLGESYVFIVKLHPFIEQHTHKDDELSDFVIRSSFDISSLLCSADILISDYSSVIFEYSLLQRPMIFYAYDLEEYEEQRSFYYEYKEFVPGKIVNDTPALIDAVLNAGISSSQKLKHFKDDFMSACDGHSTDRIADMIIKKT
ncbi:MAG: CDP-glycerol glycerophosphotransferase family protein [Oscillospiraceae bacterium]|jgi:CDP-ribitol ribitolphosphotransferase|nr:CDP-glycerol glycerophosphotransferase family protein [Oscillospiraceae bacterium]